MARNAFGLGFLFTAEDRASRTIQKVDRNFKKMDRSTTRSAQRTKAAQGAMMAGTAAIAAGTLGLATAFKTATAAGDFEQSIARVGAITQASAEDMRQLEQAALQAGLKSQFSPKETADGLGELGVRGLSTADSMKALDGALDLAAGGQISISQAASTTASALKVFGIEADQASLAADKLLKVSNVTALQANDLELALGTVSRGASAAKQSIDEMLPSIGLVKNTGVDASVAASSVSSALLMMAKNAKLFKSVGVQVTDANGNFRNFMDVILDTQGALSQYDDAAERAAKATKLFGRFGITAFTAIGKQLEDGIRTPTGEILKGADAMEFLRKSMANAEGTAKKFKDALLDTLPGQLTLLRGSIETLMVTMGKPLAAAMKPVVEIFRDTVNAAITAFNKLPEGMRRSIGIILVVTSALMALAGVITVVGAGIVLAAPTIGALLSALSSAAPVIVGVGAALAAMAVVLATLRFAAARDLGGIGTLFQSVFTKIKLFVLGFVQLWREGLISGDVAKQLSQPGNIPIVRFLVFLFGFGKRLRVFVSEMRKGFTDFLVANSDAFGAFAASLVRMGEAIFGTGDEAATSLGPVIRFMRAGLAVGTRIAQVLMTVIKALSFYISMWAGVVKVVRGGFRLMAPLFVAIRQSVMAIGASFLEIAETLGIFSSDSKDAGKIFEELGMIIGFVHMTFIAPVIGAFTIMARVMQFWARVTVGLVKLIKGALIGAFFFLDGISKLMNGDVLGAFESFGKGLRSVFSGVADFFTEFANAIREQITGLLDMLANVAERLPSAVRPAILTQFIESRKTALRDEQSDELTRQLEVEADRGQSVFTNMPVIPFANNTAGAAEAEASRAQPMSPEQHAKALETAMTRVMKNNQAQSKDQVVQLVLDGEIISQISQRQSQRATALSFGGGPSEID